ncbi:hypothetical protein [Clostridium gasigenes]|nr:hypothetical protein [Clostridium gasigenes]
MSKKLSSREALTLLLQVAEISRFGYYRWLNKGMIVSEKSKR